MSHEASQDAGGRKYRSKKQRPCDLCRTRKSQCRIQNGNTTCELCKRLSRPCTFVLQPLRRERHQPDLGATEASGDVQPDGEGRNELQEQSTQRRQDYPQHELVTDLEINEPPLWLSPPRNGVAPYHPSSASPLVAMEWTPMEFPLDSAVSGETGDVVSGFDLSQFGAAGSFGSNEEMGNVYDPASPRRPDQDLASSSQSSPQHGDWPVEFSLDSEDTKYSQLIGLSGESDPYVLRHYQYNMLDTYPMFRLSFRKMLGTNNMIPSSNFNAAFDEPRSQAGYPPVQFVLSDKNLCQDDLKAVVEMLSGGKMEDDDAKHLENLIPNDMGIRLLDLYIRVIHPRYPILSIAELTQGSNGILCPGLPVGIRAAIFALAIPFSFLDDELSVSKGYVQPSTDGLWAIVQRSFQRSMCTSRLSSLQLCLLLLQKPPLNFAVADSPNTWALSCSALAIAESLGLNLEPSHWRLPQSEKKLRKRLWWFTYMQHVWHALLFGRPSHLNEDNWDVSKLSLQDFDTADSLGQELQQGIDEQKPVLIALIDLTCIAALILRDLYTLRAARTASSLQSILARAQPLRGHLEQWKHELPFDSTKMSSMEDSDLEQCAALRLSYLTLEILVYRALLRPLEYGYLQISGEAHGPALSIIENSYVCSQLGAELVGSLKSQHFTLFWPPYQRYQLCYISSLILMNFGQSPTKEIASKNRDLLNKWRNTLRAHARAWPLARLATMRLDATFWKGLSVAIHGAGPGSPALSLLKEQGSQASGDGCSPP